MPRTPAASQPKWTKAFEVGERYVDVVVAEPERELWKVARAKVEDELRTRAADAISKPVGDHEQAVRGGFRLAAAPSA